jgi:hypothetical protein
LFIPVGALLGLFITSEPLSLSAMIGILMLIGIVVTNAIVYVDRVGQNRDRGMAIDESLVEAGKTRLRPILMTAFATICALLPLAFTASEGNLISKGLAVVVIGGLTTSYAGVWDNGSPFQGIGLISVPDLGITFSSMVVNYGGGDEQQVRVIPGFGIQIISDMGGTESNIYVNEAKVDLSYDGSGARIELSTSGIRLNTTQELSINGATGWSGTYSTGDGRVATVTKGIITDVS